MKKLHFKYARKLSCFSKPSAAAEIQVPPFLLGHIMMDHRKRKIRNVVATFKHNYRIRSGAQLGKGTF